MCALIPVDTHTVMCAPIPVDTHTVIGARSREVPA